MDVERYLEPFELFDSESLGEDVCLPILGGTVVELDESFFLGLSSVFVRDVDVLGLLRVSTVLGCFDGALVVDVCWNRSGFVSGFSEDLGDPSKVPASCRESDVLCFKRRETDGLLASTRPDDCGSKNFDDKSCCLPP